MRHTMRRLTHATLFAGLTLAGATVGIAAFAQSYPAGWRGEVTGAVELDKCRNYADTRQLFLNAIEGYLDPWVYTSAEISVMTVADFEELLKQRWRAAGVDVDDPDLFNDPSVYLVELDSRFETFGCNGWSEGKDWDIIVVEIKKASSTGASEAGKGLSREAEPLQGNVAQRGEATPEAPNDGGQSQEDLNAEVQALVEEISRDTDGTSENPNDGGQTEEELSPELQAFLDDVARGGDGTPETPAGGGQSEEEQRAEVQALLDEISRGTDENSETPARGGQTEEEQRAEVEALLDEISRDIDGTAETPVGTGQDEGGLSPEAQALLDDASRGTDGTPDTLAGGAKFGPEPSPEPQDRRDDITRGTDIALELPVGGGVGAQDGTSPGPQALLRDRRQDFGSNPDTPSDTPTQIARRSDIAVANRGSGAPVGDLPAEAARVDPRLVGTWTLIDAPGFDWSWEIRGDGTYTLRNAGQTIHEGTVTFVAGTWTLRSPLWQDGGRYTLIGERQATIIGTLGPGTWVRGDR